MRRKSSTFFLFDVAFLANSRWRQLMKRLPDDDDFNSAVGAFVIALAAARGNGLPELDVRAETNSRFVDDLIAVGLLTADGIPEKPFNEYAPARPSYPSDTKAPSAPKATKTPHHSVSSPPLPSIPINSNARTENVPTARDDDPLAMYWQLAGRYPSGKVKVWVETMAETYGDANTCRALAQAHIEKPDKFLGLAEDLLKAGVVAAERAERDRAAREKTEAQHRPKADLTPVGGWGTVEEHEQLQAELKAKREAARG